MKPLLSYHKSLYLSACVGAYLGSGTFSVRGSTENDHAIAHLDVRPCTYNACQLLAIHTWGSKIEQVPAKQT